MKKLKVRFNLDRNNSPLLTIANLPGGDADLYPDQARTLANALLLAADESEKKTAKRIIRTAEYSW